MKPINRIGIVLRPDSPNLKNMYLQIKECFLANGINSSLESKSADMIGLDGVEFQSLARNSDMLVALGGDGTLIAMIRDAIDYDIACMGINTGRLGFLTAITPDRLDSLAKDLKIGKYDIKKHLMLEASVESSDKKTKKLIALNEFLISKVESFAMINIVAKIDGKAFNTYTCDGLIIGTPTGSTAYNISVGGSVIYPYCRNILLTPIAPHSLTQRPLVLSDEFCLSFSLSQKGTLIGDGQNTIEIQPNETIHIKSFAKNALIAYCLDRDYFAVLKEKFSWGQEH